VKINDLEFFLVQIARVNFLPPVRSLLVRLSTDRGWEGWGEAAVAWRPGELTARRDLLLPVLAGRSVYDIEELQLLDSLASPPLRCAIEMACWDLMGRGLGQPVCNLLGGGYRRRVPLAVGLASGRPQRVARFARELAAQGFHCQTIASSRQMELDRLMVSAVRETVGDAVQLRLDAEAHYDMETARDLCAAIEYERLQFLLDPLDTRELYPVASLGRQTSVPLAVWRAVDGPDSVLAVARCGAAPFLVIDLEQVGGIAPARNCAAVASAAGITALVGGRPKLGIATAGMLHLAAATPALSGAHPSTYHELRDDVLAEPLEIIDGMMTVPQGPGLGIEVERAKVEQHSVVG
jgi:L-alanine-DL-glutamate epimerase-like enolase superfamily enzyme